MKDRLIVVTIDTILDILKSYVGAERLPANASALSLMIDPKQQGKFAIRAESPEWPEGCEPLNVHFDIKRMFSPSVPLLKV